MLILIVTFSPTHFRTALSGLRFTNSFPFTSFAAPHNLTPLESHRSENRRGAAPIPVFTNLQNATIFRINTCKNRASNYLQNQHFQISVKISHSNSVWNQYLEQYRVGRRIIGQHSFPPLLHSCLTLFGISPIIATHTKNTGVGVSGVCTYKPRKGKRHPSAWFPKRNSRCALCGGSCCTLLSSVDCQLWTVNFLSALYSS